ncbi:MAG: PDZ domain-containing protein, partial [Gemmatimonadota bacterium]
AAVSIDPQNKGNTFISYYPFGEAIALALDLTLRERGHTLDEFMRDMWKTHGAQQNFAPVRPYSVADAQAALARVIGDAGFARDFFARYVTGHDAAAYGELLKPAGFVMRPASPDQAWLGDVALRYEDGAAVVLAPTPIGTPIYTTGADRNDRIRSLDGRTLTSAADLNAVLAAHKPGETIPIVYESRGSTITASLTLTASPRVEIVTFEAAGEPVTDNVRAFRAAWLEPR